MLWSNDAALLLNIFDHTHSFRPIDKYRTFSRHKTDASSHNNCAHGKKDDQGQCNGIPTPAIKYENTRNAARFTEFIPLSLSSAFQTFLREHQHSLSISILTCTNSTIIVSWHKLDQKYAPTLFIPNTKYIRTSSIIFMVNTRQLRIIFYARIFGNNLKTNPSTILFISATCWLLFRKEWSNSVKVN